MQIDTQTQRLVVVADANRSQPAAQPMVQTDAATKAGKVDAKVSLLDAARDKQQQQEKDAAKPTDEDVQGAVQRLSEYVQNAKRDLLFSVDKDTGKTVIQVLDSKTKEVVRQIPPDEILALARHMHDVTEETGGLLKLRV